jgi:hypothetical protein
MFINIIRNRLTSAAAAAAAVESQTHKCTGRQPIDCPLKLFERRATNCPVLEFRVHTDGQTLLLLRRLLRNQQRGVLFFLK